MTRQRSFDIDESKHEEPRTLLKRLKDSVAAIFMGTILFQVLLFSFYIFAGGYSVVLWFDNPFFITYLIGCGILGWMYGERFVQTLSRKSAEWDLWSHWWFR